MMRKFAAVVCLCLICLTSSCVYEKSDNNSVTPTEKALLIRIRQSHPRQSTCILPIQRRKNFTTPIAVQSDKWTIKIKYI